MNELFKTVTTEQFKQYYFRDFPFLPADYKGDDPESYILDSDIEKAMGQALITANERFGEDDEQKIIIFLHLVAFYLVMDLKNSSQGINSSYSGLLSSKSVGDVSESYNFPSWVMTNPNYSIFLQNGYGMKYLSLVLPYISTTILFAQGQSTYG